MNSCSIFIFAKMYGFRDKTLLFTSQLEIQFIFCNVLIWMNFKINVLAVSEQFVLNLMKMTKEQTEKS